MKVCTDCIHHQKLISDWCRAKEYMEVSIVTGKAEERGAEYCSLMRRYGECGQEAKLFKPKPPTLSEEVVGIWTRIKGWFNCA